jgi:RimJ/RimL family protein N-acetyltransferase
MNKEMKKVLIKTKRLIIRNFLVNDFNDLFEYLSDIEIYRFEPGSPINIEMAKILCKERSKDNKFLAVVLKDKVIGHIYFSQIEPRELMTWETGYIFNRKYQKNGFATESLKAVIEYGFKNLCIHKIIAHCNPKNISSWKLLERVNVKREGKLRKNIYFRKDNKGNPIWLDTYEYGILKEDR